MSRKILNRILSVTTALVLSGVLTACTGVPAQSGPANAGGSKPDNAAVSDNDTGKDDSGKDDSGNEASVNAGTDDSASAEPAAGEQDGNASAGSEADMGFDGSWKQVYLDLIENRLSDYVYVGEYDDINDWNFGFIYVNNDDIPELVISSGYEAAGSVVFTTDGNSLDSFVTNRLGLYYIPYGNYINNSDGIMGYYSDRIYSIENGKFSLEGSGDWTEIYGDNGYEDTEYSWNGDTVTEEAYFSKIESMLPASGRFYYYRGTTIDCMQRYLNGNGPKDYKEAYREIIESGILTEDGESSYPAYALIEKTDSDPLLLMSSDVTYRVASFDEGLVNIGLYNYFPSSSDEISLLYPQLGMIERMDFYVGSSYGFYTVVHGTILGQYLTIYDRVDEDGNIIENEEGYPESKFTLNGTEVSGETAENFLIKFDEVFKQQMTAYSDDSVYIDYVSGDAMLDMLK